MCISPTKWSDRETAHQSIFMAVWCHFHFSLIIFSGQYLFDLHIQANSGFYVQRVSIYAGANLSRPWENVVFSATRVMRTLRADT